ncbi:hypothetical protein DFH11DRAFT_828725 [Phellopilus nigrolimitatus]|nr:hypothetical protein DFH11DRAFT_828725 [Phellopilus nigrolimitatus]
MLRYPHSVHPYQLFRIFVYNFSRCLSPSTCVYVFLCLLEMPVSPSLCSPCDCFLALLYPRAYYPSACRLSVIVSKTSSLFDFWFAIMPYIFYILLRLFLYLVFFAIPHNPFERVLVLSGFARTYIHKFVIMP